MGCCQICPPLFCCCEEKLCVFHRLTDMDKTLCMGYISSPVAANVFCCFFFSSSLEVSTILAWAVIFVSITCLRSALTKEGSVLNIGRHQRGPEEDSCWLTWLSGGGRRSTQGFSAEEAVRDGGNRGACKEWEWGPWRCREKKRPACSL